ncbi:hypothetical protein AB0B66_10415 [Catellatospora sp. NPDC049111]|uniref:hypothetical protein n=1 Tax=Catellatospora sp. NPDC049111 TaxID=3155271 RepID=UPI0033E8E7C6
MTQERLDWLRDCLRRDRDRLLDTAREAAGTPAGRVVCRLAMDQVADVGSKLKILDIVEQAPGDDPRFEQIIAWLAYSRNTAPGYLDTWAPDEVDLVAQIKLLDELDQ